ncbi:phosphatase PAP2 family protein [Paenibacillus roseipurpureus]|uniref:Phosphatase PAP2 family protein n=1 Tax=Paenibacillus roseopurpureus TaxID=2918901 RepID=A0AA96LQJ7_9BACL|nr:phosphatase PAP2 family protein [Paenibacillus sp. MBLB1832]WNR43993.1 phosphatase PAP2 family protein [Paenibacillus sp. MBLB1832]
MKGKGLVKDMMWSIGAAGTLLLAFIVLSRSLTASWLDQFDQHVGVFIRDQRADAWTSVAKVFTFLGSGSTEFILFFLVGGILIFKFKHKWETLVLFVGVLGAWLMNTALKGIFERDRPAADGWLIEEDGFSFPSGHSMVSILFYGLLAYLLWVNMRRIWKAAWLVPVIGIVIIVCIGLSRIYLGVHYPSDVVAGYLAGGIGLIGCTHAVRRIRHRQAGRIDTGRDYMEKGHKFSQ